MSHHYQKLKFVTVAPDSVFHNPDRGYEDLTLDSPALAAMTDFRMVRAMSVLPSTPIDEALEKMKMVEVRMLLVANSDRTLQGIISSHDIIGERAIEFIRINQVRREKVQVQDVMLPIQQLSALSLTDVLDARVGHVIATLNGLGQQHILVTSYERERPVIRGIFSAAELARQLNTPLHPMSSARTFAELGQILFAH